MQRLRSLKADQRTALVLQAAGYSYREIGERRGWTYTKVNRCVTEGRRALR
jgi:DNA-directed RNA polymerase specialized sigma24 family protein